MGGTKILAGVVDREGRVLRRHLAESPVSAETDVLAALERAVAEVLDDSVAAIGLGVPANLERGTGRVVSAVNLPLTDLDVAGRVRRRFGLPVGIENDAGANSATVVSE